LLLVAACAPPVVEAPPGSPVVVSTPAGSAAPVATADDPEPPASAREAALAERLCRGRQPCRLLRVHDAGTDAGGRSLAVGLVHLGPEQGKTPTTSTADEGGWQLGLRGIRNNLLHPPSPNPID